MILKSHEQFELVSS